MCAPDRLKELYPGAAGGTKYKENQTLTHNLLEYHPRFLMLNKPWVSALLEKEKDLTDEIKRGCLMRLLMSDKLDDFDFNCVNFK